MRRLIPLAALAIAAACAQQAFPPGGPPRHTPPEILSISPESGAVNVTAKAFTIAFDEVVSERPALGGQSLGDLFLISPRDGIPRISWHRTRIDVRGQRAWKPNTAYTITMRPGLADLHNNVLKRSLVVVFSTGGAIPSTAIRGVVFDWATGKPVVSPLVQVFLAPDSTQYITLGDSAGRFTLLTLPAGPITVRGTWDQNNNRALDLREAWDTVAVQLKDSATVEIYAFVHDSLGPHLSDVTLRDSVTVHAAFDKPVDIAQHLDTTTFVLRAKDSSIVPLTFVGPWRDFDKARTDSAARADSIAALTDSVVKKRLQANAAAVAALKARNAGRDTTPKAPPPVPTRAIPNSEYVLITAQPLATGTYYRLEAHGVRNLLGDTASSAHSLQIPKPPPPPPPAPAKAPSADTTHAPASAPPAPRDAVQPPPPPPKPPVR